MPMPAGRLREFPYASRFADMVVVTGDVADGPLGGRHREIAMFRRLKPKYGFFSWGAMVFTGGLASDILFYSFCEWIYYYEDAHVMGFGDINEWAATFPLYHWSLIPWSFYAVLAAAFGFMLHVRGCHKQKYSEACRPLLGKHIDGPWGNCYGVNEETNGGITILIKRRRRRRLKWISAN